MADVRTPVRVEGEQEALLYIFQIVGEPEAGENGLAGTRARHMVNYTIRTAIPADTETLVAFALREAREAERLELDHDAVRRGVGAAFEHPPRANYWVATTADDRVVASASVVREWSNFRGGDYWWVQSLYVDPEHRGRALARHLLDHLTAAAAAAGALDLRLYVHEANERARRAYERSGFILAPYAMMSRKLR